VPPSQAPDPCYRARSLSLSRLQALCDLEANSNDLKAELRELYIVSAKEVDVTGRKAVVIFVPFKLLKVVHKIQSRLVRELEKKFSGKHVVLIGQRRIMRKPSAGQRQPKQKRPVSR
jgi:small subunit ribosomal protein S7e